MENLKQKDFVMVFNSYLHDCNDNWLHNKQSTGYRPFKDAKECVEELNKHTPNGYVKIKDDRYGDRYSSVLSINDDGLCLGVTIGHLNFDDALTDIVFADGSVFGKLCFAN